MLGETLYTFREVGPNRWECTCFEDGRMAYAKDPGRGLVAFYPKVYTIRGAYCDCLSRNAFCKHRRMQEALRQRFGVLAVPGVFVDPDTLEMHVDTMLTGESGGVESRPKKSG